MSIFHPAFEMSIRFGVKAHDCIIQIEKYREKFGNKLRYNEANSEKLKDIRAFLIQCNEAYILRKHHLKHEF